MLSRPGGFNSLSIEGDLAFLILLPHLLNAGIPGILRIKHTASCILGKHLMGATSPVLPKPERSHRVPDFLHTSVLGGLRKGGVGRK